MGSAKHVSKFKNTVEQEHGVELWNEWRARHKFEDLELYKCELPGKDLSKVDLSRAYLYGANFEGAILREANLSGAHLRRARFNRADLSDAWMLGAALHETEFKGAKLDGARVHGISAWRIKTDTETKQRGLIITPDDEPDVSVDDIEVAQFIYLLLKNEKIRDVITAVTSKSVLILGRFTEERKVVLEAIREELRKRHLVPIIFDWEPSPSRDLTDTIQLLANMARFVIADVTDAKSIPQELSTIIPHLPSVPVRLLILASQQPYIMIDHWLGPKFTSVLPVYPYESSDKLIAEFDEIVMQPVELWEQETDKAKAAIGALQRENEQLREQLRQSRKQ